MPFYNNKRDLEKAIKSIVKNVIYPDKVELILVDDCSEDGSFIIAQEYTEKYDFIKLIENEINLGPAKALKRALQLSKGDIIIFSAADDISCEHRLTELTNIFRVNEDVGIVVSEAEIIDEEDNPTGEYYRLPPNINLENSYLYQLKRNYCLGATMAIRNRQDIFAKEGFLELIDDYQISLDYMLAGLKIYPLKKVLLKYRVHSKSVSARKKELYLKTLTALKEYSSKDFEYQLLLLGYSLQDIYLSLGIFELFKENEHEAEKYFEKLEPISTNIDSKSKVEYYFYQGIIKFKKGKHDDAARFWEKILIIEPDNFVVLNNLGILIANKDKQRALRLIEAANKINPNYLDGNINLKIIRDREDKELLITQRLLPYFLIKKEKYMEE